MRSVLLTGGRGVYALTLARAFRAAGHKVLVADAWPRTLCRFSSAVDRYFCVPSPARATRAWVAAILQIVDEQAVDLIVPVYEEVFYLAQATARMIDPPPLFAPDFESLIGLHDKWRFNQRARMLGLSAPNTELLTRRGDLLRVFHFGDGREKVFKPAYSRFAAHTVVRPQSLHDLIGIEPSPRRPWVAQEYLAGKPFATITIAHRGRITAHATYATDFSHDLGPTDVYCRAEQPDVFDWVRTFVTSTQYTGQIGLDFIENEAGGVSAIECNPRLTGGMYLLKDDPQFAEAYFDPLLPLVEASRDRSYAFRFWLMLTLLRHTDAFPGFREWCRQLLRVRSTNGLHLSDPLPRLAGPLLIGEFLWRCFADKTSPREMVTRDFEWSEDVAASESSADAALQRAA